MDIFDFDVQSYASFKSTRYNMRNSEAVLFTGCFRTDVFKFSFFNCIVDLWNGLPVVIRILISYLCLVKKLMNFIVLNLISIRKDFYSFFLYTIVSTGDLIFYLISS